LNVLPLWYFNPDKENIKNTLRITQSLKNFNIIHSKLTLNNNMFNFPRPDKWYGCFGAQSYINHDFLLQINNKYNIINLVRTIKNRSDRCCLERIIGCIFFTESNNLIKIKSLFGDIMIYQNSAY